MPLFPVPEGETQESLAGKEVARGLRPPLPGRRARRATGSGPSTSWTSSTRWGSRRYFLVVADLCRYARDNGIRVGPGRGSATGSIVAYALGITELDPIEHGLLFERFLNPERITPPDIDLDFDERRRGDMIRYVTEKYGDERVSQIITFGTIKAKAAVKDAARMLGLPVRDGRPDHQGDAAGRDGQGHPARRHLRPGPPALRRGGRVPALSRPTRTSRKVFDTARGIEGLIRGSRACTRPG